MNFWGHVAELRSRLLFLLGFYVLAAVVSFFFMDDIMKFLQIPVSSHDVHLYYKEPSEKFFTYCRSALSCALFIIIPAAVFQFWRFVIPALSDGERRVFGKFMFAAVILFYVGTMFAWKLVVPFAIDFFLDFAKDDGILPLWGIADYIGIVLMMLVVVGFVFEIPVVMLSLMKIGALTHELAARARRYVVPVIYLLAAVLTPPDAITQIIVGSLLWGMYELTILIGRFF